MKNRFFWLFYFIYKKKKRKKSVKQISKRERESHRTSFLAETEVDEEGTDSREKDTTSNCTKSCYIIIKSQ